MGFVETGSGENQGMPGWHAVRTPRAYPRSVAWPHVRRPPWAHEKRPIPLERRTGRCLITSSRSRALHCARRIGSGEDSGAKRTTDERSPSGRTRAFADSRTPLRLRAGEERRRFQRHRCLHLLPSRLRSRGNCRRRGSCRRHGSACDHGNARDHGSARDHGNAYDRGMPRGTHRRRCNRPPHRKPLRQSTRGTDDRPRPSSLRPQGRGKRPRRKSRHQTPQCDSSRNPPKLEQVTVTESTPVKPSSFRAGTRSRRQAIGAAAFQTSTRQLPGPVVR